MKGASFEDGDGQLFSYFIVNINANYGVLGKGASSLEENWPKNTWKDFNEIKFINSK